MSRFGIELIGNLILGLIGGNGFGGGYGYNPMSRFSGNNYGSIWSGGSTCPLGGAMPTWSAMDNFSMGDMFSNIGTDYMMGRLIDLQRNMSQVPNFMFGPDGRVMNMSAGQSSGNGYVNDVLESLNPGAKQLGSTHFGNQTRRGGVAQTMNFGSLSLLKKIPGTEHHDMVDRERRRQLFANANYYTAMAFNESINKKNGSIVADMPYNYYADNGHHWGKYQLGAPALEDLGILDENGRWTGKIVQGMAINSLDDFKNNHAGQEELMAKYTARNWATIKNEPELLALIGHTKHGINITKATLLAGAHLKGVGGLKDFLLNNNDNYDGNNVAISAYMWEFQNVKDPVNIG